MPNGVVWVPMSEILSIEEIVFTVRAMSKIGINKIKITGGEPLVRKGCLNLIKMLKGIPGIDEVTLTTNGVLLEENLPSLIDAGIRAVNISLDTLDREKYKMITGYDHLNKVLSSVEASINSGIFVKLNAVSVNWALVEGNKTNYEDESRVLNEAIKLVEFARSRNICVRFIEMMPIGLGKEYPGIPHSILIPGIMKRYEGMEPDNKKYGNGPAVYYSIPGFMGKIGFISAINDKFCDSCDRVRLTVDGNFKTCLCYDKGVGLKNVLRSDKSDVDKEKNLMELMRQAIIEKPESHCFEDKSMISEKRTMSSIGG